MVTTSVRRYWLYSNLRLIPVAIEMHFRQLRQQPGLSQASRRGSSAVEDLGKPGAKAVYCTYALFSSGQAEKDGQS